MEQIIVDNELIKRAKEFDESALEDIFRLFRPIIKKMSLKYFFAGADKEDVVQEAMIALFGAIRSYNPEKSDNFTAFASHCIELRLKSVVKTSLRKKHSPLNLSVSIDENPLITDSAPYSDPEEEYINNERFVTINEQLKSVLSDYELSVVSLLILGMNASEIAGILKKDAKSVDNAIQRIRKKAAKIL